VSIKERFNLLGPSLKYLAILCPAHASLSALLNKMQLFQGAFTLTVPMVFQSSNLVGAKPEVFNVLVFSISVLEWEKYSGMPYDENALVPMEAIMQIDPNRVKAH